MDSTSTTGTENSRGAIATENTSNSLGSETLRVNLPWVVGLAGVGSAIATLTHLTISGVWTPALITLPMALVLVPFALWLSAHRPDDPHSAATLVAAVLFAMPLVYQWFAPNPVNLVGIALVTLGVFYMYTDWRWLVVAQAIGLASFAGTVAMVSASLDLAAYTSAVIACAGGGLALHVARMRTLKRLDGASREVGAQKLQLSSALQELSEEAGERQRAQREAASAQKFESLGLMAGGVAHDFNNLLVAILGGTELALENLDDPERLRQALHTVRAASLDARDLCGQMLDYAGGRPVLHKPLEVRTLVRTAVSRAIEGLGPGVSFKLDFGKRIPPINGDRARLQQLLLNLFRNASEAMTGREGEIRIRVFRSDSEPTGVRVEVEDAGIGISPELRDRIFDPFFSTKFSGRGLGLSSVLGTVRSHGGTITVSSEPNRGTRFTLEFPPADTRVARPETLAGPPPPTRRVLVVDDEPAVRETVVQLLELLGYEAEACAEGNEAIVRFQAGPDEYCAALVDATMPGVDGNETVTALRRIRPALPVVVSSGYRENDCGLDTLPGGPVLFLTKPFGRAELSRCFGELLGPEAQPFASPRA